jgi:hypothetical protein
MKWLCILIILVVFMFICMYISIYVAGQILLYVCYIEYYVRNVSLFKVFIYIHVFINRYASVSTIASSMNVHEIAHVAWERQIGNIYMYMCIYAYMYIIVFVTIIFTIIATIFVTIGSTINVTIIAKIIYCYSF